MIIHGYDISDCRMPASLTIIELILTLTIYLSTGLHYLGVAVPSVWSVLGYRILPGLPRDGHCWCVLSVLLDPRQEEGQFPCTPRYLVGVQISSRYCRFRLLHHRHHPADQDHPSLHPEQVSGHFTLFS